MKTVVVYHADCPDGFGAAWAAWRKLGDSAEYIPMHRGEEPPERIFGAKVFLLDYCFPADTLIKLKDAGTHLVLIDHHATDAANVELVHESRFDLNHSGAVLAWGYFHNAAPVPKLLQHIEDFDLWRFQLPGTKELDQALSIKPKEFQTWTRISEEMETDEGFDLIMREGAILCAKAEQAVQRLADSAEEVDFEGHRVLMVNSPNHVSELGHELTKRRAPFGIVWSRRGKMIVVSLRGDGTIDVSKMAQKYGGGGHPSSAAFRWEQDTLLNFKNK